MKKFISIINIIIYFVVTVVALCNLFPKDSYLGICINGVWNYINNNELFANFLSIVVLILAIALIIICIVDIGKVDKKHRLKCGNRKFCKFFSKWYKRPGRLSIICDDLEDWIVFKNNKDIYEALKFKSDRKELYLYLGERTPADLVNELEKLGAVINNAPQNLIANYSFSCLSVMGNNSAVIVRNKHLDHAQEIILEEVNDSYVTNLLNTLITMV